MAAPRHYPATQGLAQGYLAFLPDVLRTGWIIRFDGPGEYHVNGFTPAMRTWSVDENLPEAFQDFLSIDVAEVPKPALSTATAATWTSIGRLLALSSFRPADVHRYAARIAGYYEGISEPIASDRAMDKHAMHAFLEKWGPLTRSDPQERESIWDYHFVGPLLDVKRIVARDDRLTVDQRLQLAISMLRSLPEESLLIALTYAALAELSDGRADYRPCENCNRWFYEPEFDELQHIKGERLRPGRESARFCKRKCQRAHNARVNRRRKVSATTE